MRDLGSEGPFKPSQYGLDFSFGIGVPLDPKIGYYASNQNY